MPDRVRKIGPEVSREVIGHILLRRLELGWSRARLCTEMRDRGYEMTPRTLQNIETGVITPGQAGRQVRLVTVDELSAFAETLLLDEEELRTGNWSDEQPQGEAREEVPDEAVDPPVLHPGPPRGAPDGSPYLDPPASSVAS
jgi:hypothetical protein